MSWLDDSKVGDKWTALKASCDGAAGKVPATEFAEAALTIISVFDLISGMGVASGDMKGNADTVKSHGQKAAAGATLQDLIEAEIAGKDAKAIGKIVGDGKTISCALLWLIRCAGQSEMARTHARDLIYCRCRGYAAVALGARPRSARHAGSTLSARSIYSS